MTEAPSDSEARRAASWRFTLDVDPAKIGTAQQKRFDPRTRRFFTDRRVAAGMKAVSKLAKSARIAQDAEIPPYGAPVALTLTLYYAVPKTRRKGGKHAPAPTEGSPCTARWAGDVDNRPKAVIDALTDAGLWPDDQFVTRADLRKRWTFGRPRIEACVRTDFGEGA